MSMTTPGLSPDDARKAVREMAYPNTEAETENVKRVDEAAFDMVRPFEQSLIAQATGHLDRTDKNLKAAKTLSTEMFKEVELPLLDSRQVNLDVTEADGRFQRLQSEAQMQIALLERAAARAEWEAERCDDPYAAFNLLLDRYPGLRTKGNITL